jgi:hypothetical protein
MFGRDFVQNARNGKSNHPPGSTQQNFFYSGGLNNFHNFTEAVATEPDIVDQAHMAIQQNNGQYQSQFSVKFQEDVAQMNQNRA